MGEFNDRLIDCARAMGARHVRIEHGGGRGSARRFRRHPHLTGELNGNPFKYPIKGRPRDASRGYRRSSLRNLEAYLHTFGLKLHAELSAHNPTAPEQPSKPKKKHRSHCPNAATPRVIAGTAPGPTRLDLDPWAALLALIPNSLAAE